MTVPLGDLLLDFMKMLILSTAMSGSSFVCGLIPLSIQLSPIYLRYVSLLSMGLLLSTSLILVIPEGIEGVYEVSDSEKAPRLVGGLLLLGFLVMYIVEHFHLLVSWISPGVKYSPQLDVELQDPSQHDTKLSALQRYVVVPFVKFTKPMTTSPVTLGLVIHSITDGIVLTSSIFASNTSMNFIVFIAIFIHKLPTSFSLSSILMAEGFSKPTVKLHLFIFSSSLMIGSLFSFIVFQVLSKSANSMEPVVAYLLMISGGTFLYIGVHTMVEILGDHHADLEPPSSSSTDDTIVVNANNAHSNMNTKEFFITILGFLLPLFTLLFDE